MNPCLCKNNVYTALYPQRARLRNNAVPIGFHKHFQSNNSASPRLRNETADSLHLNEKSHFGRTLNSILVDLVNMKCKARMIDKSRICCSGNMYSLNKI